MYQLDQYGNRSHNLLDRRNLPVCAQAQPLKVVPKSMDMRILPSDSASASPRFRFRLFEVILGIIEYVKQELII